MRIWALSDLHLSLGTQKPMDVFGSHWANHQERMAEAWDRLVAPQDLVLSPGDVSWASNESEAAPDFAWIAQRPGRKIIVKGNHDYWWPKSKTRLATLLGPQAQALKRNAIIIDGVLLFGARGGDFAPLKQYGDTRSPEDIAKALDHEQHELQLSLEALTRLEAEHAADIRLRICCFHYPPLPPGRVGGPFLPLILKGKPQHCVYGHLHGPQVGSARCEGLIEGVQFTCASCDLLDFTPKLIAEI